MILVTGATGMVGRAVVYRLLSDGVSVRAHGRSKSALEKLFPRDVDAHSHADAVTIKWGNRYSSEKRTTRQSLEPVVCDLSTMTPGEAERLCEGCSAIVHA